MFLRMMTMDSKAELMLEIEQMVVIEVADADTPRSFSSIGLY